MNTKPATPLPRRRYTAPLDSERCVAQADTAAGNDGGVCMHRRKYGALCTQHAARAYPELVAALRLYQAAFESIHPITGEAFCEFLPAITPVVKEARALLAKLGEDK